jgi:hypothetical protein
MSQVWDFAPKVWRFLAVPLFYTIGWLLGALCRPHLPIIGNGYVRFIIYIALAVATMRAYDLTMKRFLRLEKSRADRWSYVAMFFFLGFYLKIFM